MAHNLELKIRCRHEQLAAAEANAVNHGLTLTRLHQVDTYFTVPRGRLKLRQITPEWGMETAELISYARPNTTGPRWSAYRRVALPIAEAAEICLAPTETVGRLVVVRKQRRVALHGRTRIHLDDVTDLGAFIELETVVTTLPDAQAAADLATTAALIGVDPESSDTIAGSYADLLLGRDDRSHETRTMP